MRKELKGKSPFSTFLVTLFAISFLWFSCSSKSSVRTLNLPFPLLGFSGGSFLAFPSWVTGRVPEEKAVIVAPLVRSAGARWYRGAIPWGDVEEEVTPRELPSAPDEVSDGMVESYAKHLSPGFSEFKGVVSAFRSAGVNLMAVLGTGYSHNLPYIKGSMNRAIPDVLGPEKYLAGIYLYARATVREFKDAVGIWQIENELNVACETVLWGWRDGRMWCDGDFLRSLMEVLQKAVREEDPHAVITHNFHTDLHWLREVDEWYDLLDIIGLDAYPNYINGSDPQGGAVGTRVDITRRWFPEKPVMVIETGYPTQPAERDFSEDGQAEYITESMLSSFQYGASGYFYFSIISSESGGDGIQAVEPYWGLVRADWTFKKGWQAYRTSANEVLENLW